MSKRRTERLLSIVVLLLSSRRYLVPHEIRDAVIGYPEQEEAFRRDDAATAYSYAAPSIRQMFPQADVFMSMVQRAYTPVYRHKSFEFGETKVEGSWIGQRVHIVDANGEAWEALYTLEQQPDGSYKITGCSLLKAGQAV